MNGKFGKTPVPQRPLVLLLVLCCALGSSSCANPSTPACDWQASWHAKNPTGCPSEAPPISAAGASCTGATQCVYGGSLCCGMCYPTEACVCEKNAQWNCFPLLTCTGYPDYCPELSDAGADQGSADATTPDVSAPDSFSADKTASAAWTAFSATVLGGCTSACAKSWTLATDGTLAIVKSAVTSSGKLSSGEWASLNAILSQGSFGQKMQDGFTCGAQTTPGISYAFSYTLGGVLHQQNVTGCASAVADDGLLVQDILAILQKY